MRLTIKSPQDFWCGMFFILLGVLAIYLARDYDMGTAVSMGPGYFPTWLGGIAVVFGLVIGILALEVGLSAQVIQEYEFVFELVGDLLTGVIGMYVFARNLRLLPKLQLGPYRFALVRNDQASPLIQSAV